MKLVFYFVFTIGFISKAYGQSPVGLGISIGDPTGVIIGQNLGGQRSWNLGLGMTLKSPSGISVYGDHQWNHGEIIDIDGHFVNFHYGLGGRVFVREAGESTDEVRVGIRGSLGLHSYLNSDKIEVFLELAPILNLLSRVFFEADGFLGIRYYFY